MVQVKIKMEKDFLIMINIFLGKNGEFSGKIKYTLDNNEEYEVYRNFSKKNPSIYDSLGNDISKNYKIDKTYGNMFFEEQTKTSEELFNMAMVINQKEVELDGKRQNVLIQKASNIMATGEDDVSYSKIISKINKRQAEEIGTDKSPTKPLYNFKKNIEELTNKKKEIEEILPLQYGIEEEKEGLKAKLNDAEKELEVMQEMQVMQNQMKIEEEKLKISSEQIEELKNKADIEKEKLDNTEIEEIDKKTSKTLYITPLLLTIIAIILYILNQKIISLITFAVDVVSIIAIFTLKLKENKQNKKNIEEKDIETNSIRRKIEELENEISEKEEIVRVKKQEIEAKEKEIKENINNRFLGVQDIDNILKENIDANNIIEQQRFINELRLNLAELDMQKEKILIDVENISVIEEKLENQKEELEKLINYNKAINIAKEAIEKAYIQMKENITPTFTVNLSNTIKNITKRKI